MQANQARQSHQDIPDTRRAFVSRGADLLYRVKRTTDGTVLVEREDKGEAKCAARQLGFFVVN